MPYENKKYVSLSDTIFDNSNNFWYPDNTKPENPIDTDSWFPITEYANNNNQLYDAKLKVNTPAKFIKCRKVILHTTPIQKTILLSWLCAYQHMYNETIKFFNKRRFLKLPKITNSRKIRTYYLYNEKIIIQNKSQYAGVDYNTKIPIHVLDEAIKDACTSYKSCLTNLERKHIKHFRLRYLKENKQTMVMSIEKNFISSVRNVIRADIFKTDFECEIEDENTHQLRKFYLNEIKCTFKIHYDRLSNKFTLLIPIKEIPKQIHQIKNTISLDPGIRKFMTGYSPNKCVKICDNLKEKIGYYLDQIDRINNDNQATKCQIKKLETRCYRKIQNVVSDLHWKSIKYLTENFNNILIGNMSTASIVKNREGNHLNARTKRIALLMSLYVFKQRLQFKCTQRKIGYKELDEAYTTMSCSYCGMYNLNVGSKETFNCDTCDASLDRDINAARNIFLSIFQKQ